MSIPEGWDAASAVRRCQVVPYEGSAWRFHHQRYDPTSSAGSLRRSGRYHRGRDLFPEEHVWPALYTALSPHIALGEALRHLEDRVALKHRRLSELRLKVEALMDLRDETALGVPKEMLIGDDLALTQSLGAAALHAGVEGVLVLSATRFSGSNIVLFTDQLRGTSLVELVRSEDPVLYVGNGE